ncbi:hypothetical protein FJTKL_11009 [Diaporthe vaccinii]|uniref:Uncharacterized protein n=1 Tax=Diaporthe vaccinii TaxID=105482 RepID=A0ABR4EIE9_9PEZI
MGLLHAPAPQREVEGEDEDQELVGFRVRLGPAEGLQHAAEQWTGPALFLVGNYYSHKLVRLKYILCMYILTPGFSTFT